MSKRFPSLSMISIRVPALFALTLVAVSLSSCATSSEPKKKDRVPPSADVSYLPWNRPPAWEGSARYGSMMPGSR